MAHHDEVDSTSECEQIGPDTGMIRWFAGQVGLGRLDGERVEEDVAVDGKVLALEVGELEIEIGV